MKMQSACALVCATTLAMAGCLEKPSNYSDSGESTSVSVYPSALTGTSTTQSGVYESAESTVTLHNPPSGGIWIAIDATESGIYSFDFYGVTETEATLVVYFKPGNSLPAGTYLDTVTLYVCYDESCNRNVGNSPLEISVSYVVTSGPGDDPDPDPQPEPGVAPLPVQSQQALAHDVIDAEYSTALDAVIMVSGYPSNALYLYDIATGTEKKQPLNKVPTSVSVGPDGNFAAVGHDALITHVDLLRIGDVVVPPITLLNVSTNVFDVVLGNTGYVYAFPAADQWVNIHSVNVSTNVETLSSGTIREDTRAKLHPSGTVGYGANNGLSPSDIEKYDFAAGPAAYLYDSPYHGDYNMCGDLWISESGLHIYTACGNVFRSSPTRAQDMVYNGALQLSSSQYYGYRILSLSQSSEQTEIALLEQDWYNCQSYGNQNECYTHLALYESAFLNRVAIYSLPPLSVAGKSYAQRGQFVFHSSDGNGKYLLSRLYAMPNPDAEYYISTLQ